ISQIDDSQDKTVVFHFRISTHAGISQYGCHPFPITGNKKGLMKLSYTTDIAVFHNGIISIDTPDSELSDTQHYIKKVLYKRYRKDKQFYLDNSSLLEIEHEITSKMVFLLPNGEYYLVNPNKFIEDDGCIYSNDSYNSTWDYYTSDNILCNEIDSNYTILYNGSVIYGCEMEMYIDEYDQVFTFDFEGNMSLLKGATVYDELGNEVYFEYENDIIEI
ncbi:MAG: hypothetical protein ACRDDY_18785, partial [Clostridium sp.]|uniref:hypothetical protein n=1 Tax=Clostridium sp. TaxID=1506 RepID=UPI003EE6CE6B